MKSLHILPIASDLGAGTRGSAFGPMTLIQALTPHANFTHSAPLSSDDQHTFSDPFAKQIGRIGHLIEHKITPAVETLVRSGQFPIILSGDHANAMGVLAGLRLAHPDKKIGVLWIDAHADMHTPFTTPSGNLHGMTLCTALNTDNLPQQINTPSHEAIQSWQTLKTLSNSTVLQPEHLVFMGLRSFEPAEASLLEEHNIAVFTVEQTRAAGVESTMEKVAQIFADVDVLYVSFDVDALDSSLIPATGTPEPNGYQVEEVKAILKYALALPQLALFELTEFNPTFDDEQQHCQQRVMDILSAAVAQLQA